MWSDNTLAPQPCRYTRARENPRLEMAPCMDDFDLRVASHGSNLSSQQAIQLFATIWQSTSRVPTLKQARAKILQDAQNCPSSLLMDPQDDDWHVICYQDDQRSLARTRCCQPDSLLARLSPKICNHSARYLRCSHLELPDLTGWLLYQQFETFKVPMNPSWAVVDEQSEKEQDISTQIMDECKRSMIMLFQTKTEVEIHLVLIAIYLAVNSFRDLSDSEFVAAVREIAKSRLAGSSQAEHDVYYWSSDRQLIDLFHPFLKQSAQRTVIFESSSVKRFLSRIRMPGLETGHETMTKLCFDQIRNIGTLIILRPWHRFKTWFRSAHKWPLLKYVTRYWFCHYQLASASRTDLSAELFHMISTAAAPSTDPTSSTMQRRIIDIGYNVAQIYNLPNLVEVFQNMGASGDVVLNEFTEENWQDMRPVLGLKTSISSINRPEPTPLDVFDVRAIIIFDRDEPMTLTCDLENMHLTADSEMSRARFVTDRSDHRLSSADRGIENLQDWQKIENTMLDSLLDIGSEEEWEEIESGRLPASLIFGQE